MKRKTPWERGYSYILRVGRLLLSKPEQDQTEYTVRECRIAAMAYEAGWQAGKRDARRRS